jgi:hypothetical protein
MDPKTLLVGILIALAAGTVFVAIILKGKGATETSVDALIPDTSCPKGTTISDIMDRMRMFAGKDSLASEPAYALDIFKQYLACKNPKKGASMFTTADIEKYNAEILMCAKSAYVNYAEELKKKSEESKAGNSKEDMAYYDGMYKNITKQQKMFDAIFPPSSYSGKVCNYQATASTQ